MSSFRNLLKLKIERSTPFWVGRFISHIPYKLRLGGQYTRTLKGIPLYENLDITEKKNLIFEYVNHMLKTSYKNNKFYRKHYDKARYDPFLFSKFEDITKIPLVSKTLLKTHKLEERSIPSIGRLRLNTGGTSGHPFDFYVDRYAFARHFAHYHYTWKSLGYHPTDIKLTFRGKNLSKSALHYNAVHNEYYVNAYCSYEKICKELLKIIHKIRYLHGYPSAIYQFVRYCIDNNPKLLDRLSSNVRGIFFDSEYPAPIYRNLIEKYITDKTLACYGHSEMALMAYEIEKNVYRPYQSFGYCEAVSGKRGYSLVGTSYFNTVSPFIRYDTGDLIKPLSVKSGILEAFEIDDGRVGDFIEDKHGKKISLTALIFGRHHDVFNYINYIQIYQTSAGKAEIILTTENEFNISDLRKLIDISNVEIDFNFKIISTPIRTKVGKVPLLVTKELLENRKNSILK